MERQGFGREWVKALDTQTGREVRIKDDIWSSQDRVLVNDPDGFWTELEMGLQPAIERYQVIK